jgi:AAA+ superfamily predicted ATPase
MGALIEQIRLMDAAYRRQGYHSPNEFEELDFCVGPPKKITPFLVARKGFEDVDTWVRDSLFLTESMGNPPPFFKFCKKYGLYLYEQLILVMLLGEGGTNRYHRGELLTVREIVDTLSSRVMPGPMIQHLFYKDGRLRKNNIISLVGPRPIIPSCRPVLKPNVFKEIYDMDYDEEIKVEAHPWEAIHENHETTSAEEAPEESLDSVVLPAEVKEAILNGLVQAKYSEVLLDRIGLGKKIHTGRGVSMLFTGPPGTGKSMAARAVASELGKRLMVVTYSQLENLCVGQTEKNIDRTFADAKRQNAVLVFDEADAVFYARSSQERSWANRDVSVLLMAIEKFEGVVILTTNSGAMLDPALERRVSIKVTFPLPDARAREQIFRGLAPEGIEAGVDFKRLSEKFEFSGGQIKNVWLNAGRLALKRTGGHPDTRISMEDLETAAKLEVQGGDAMQTTLSGSKPKGYA